MNKQVFNPYLPSWEYVPDGEPHVFGDRLYLYGSHDRFNGELYCLNDYVCWSAPDQYISNLNDGSVAGFKYFSFDHPHHISVCMKAEKDGVMEVLTAPDSEPVTLIKVSACEGRETFSAELSSLSGVLPLYFVWRSEGTADFFSFTVE
ncbi:MAG: hypothetical protein IJ252_15565 [Solobacterium sp.]|nr:hypothetical protein [Solobacterium sp.]